MLPNINILSKFKYKFSKTLDVYENHYFNIYSKLQYLS